jgi:Subtilase family/Secretion system C-terminal sorting domain
MGLICRRWILILNFLAFATHAQDNRYMVFFKDKAGTTFSTGDPSEYLSERAIERRSRQDIVVTEQDIPVNNNYVQGVSASGGQVLYSTRWMNGVLVTCGEDILPAIEDLSYVDRVEFVAPGGKPNSSGRHRSGARKMDSAGSTVTVNQLSMLGIDEMQAAGYYGEGIDIAVLDAGFPGVNTTEPFRYIIDENRLINTYDFVHDQQNVFVESDHGTSVLSVIGAYIPDAFTGGAYKASFQLYITEDVNSEYRIEEYNWLIAAERADSAGADIINTSLGYNTFSDPSMNYSQSDMNGLTTVISRAAQWAAERGIAVVSSAGNEGNNSWHIITAPADNQYVMAIAAVNSNGVRSRVSSVGPSADGRIKPDVGAMGVSVSVLKADGSIGMVSGTSLSAPLITSLLAGVWQRYPKLTNIQILDAIRSSASQAANPDNLLGYGIPNFKAIVNRLEWVPQEKRVTISPNPVTDTLIIMPNDPDDISACTFEIISLQGQIISGQHVEFNWLNRNYMADCSKLASGMYFVRVWIGQDIYSFKMVKR